MGLCSFCRILKIFHIDALTGGIDMMQKRGAGCMSSKNEGVHFSMSNFILQLLRLLGGVIVYSKKR